MFELIIGLTAFLAAMRLRENWKELLVASAMGGLIMGLFGGLIAIFLFEPALTLFGTLTGATVTTTSTIYAFMVTGISSFVLVLMYYVLASMVYSVAATAFYELALWIMKSIKL